MTIKLPKPACPKSGTRQPEDLYTHAQLVQAVKDALEEAATFCESQQVNISPRRGRIFMEFLPECGGRHEGMDYADAIREMK